VYHLALLATSQQQQPVADPGFANGGGKASAEGARIEAPKAPRG